VSDEKLGGYVIPILAWSDHSKFILFLCLHKSIYFSQNTRYERIRQLQLYLIA